MWSTIYILFFCFFMLLKKYCLFLQMFKKVKSALQSGISLFLNGYSEVQFTFMSSRRWIPSSFIGYLTTKKIVARLNAFFRVKAFCLFILPGEIILLCLFGWINNYFKLRWHYDGKIEHFLLFFFFVGEQEIAAISTKCVADLDYWSEMIILESIVATF